MVDKWVLVVVVVVFIFLLTYNPSSGTLNKVISGDKKAAKPAPSCCSDDTFRAQNPEKCKDPHYNGLQFGEPDYACPMGPDRTALGAIIQK